MKKIGRCYACEKKRVLVHPICEGHNICAKCKPIVNEMIDQMTTKAAWNDGSD